MSAKGDGLDHLRYTGRNFTVGVMIDGKEHFKGTEDVVGVRARLHRVLDGFLNAATVGREIGIKIKMNEDA